MAQPMSARLLAVLGIADSAFPRWQSSLPVRKLALRRLRRRRAIAAAQALAMMLAIVLPLGLQFIGRISADTAYQAAVGVNTADSLVTIEKVGAQSLGNYQAAQDATERSVDASTGGRLSLVSEYGRLSSFDLITVDGSSYDAGGLPRLSAVFYPELASQAVLVAGEWSTVPAKAEPIPVALSESGADLYGLHLGDVACVRSANDTSEPPTQTCVKLTGIYRPRNSSEPFWLSGPGSSDLALSSDAYWYLQQLVQHARSVAGRIYRPNPSLLTVSQAAALEQGIRNLRGAVQFSEQETVLTSLDRTIAAFLARTSTNQFPVQLVAVEVIAVVLFGLAFITQSFLASQEQQALLWRVRGWSRWRLGWFVSLQFLLLALPAVAAGFVVALFGTWAFTSLHGADFRTLASALSTTFVPATAVSLLLTLAVCLAVATRFAIRPVSVMRTSGRSRAPWWQWQNADLALAVLALPVLAEASLRTQAAVRAATANADPIGVALPILGLGMLAVAALRLLPVLARAVPAMSRGIAARLTFWRLSRQSAEHAGAATVLSLALAVGIFAAVYDGTETTSSLDRADYATGADLRVAFASGTAPNALQAQLSQLKGVRSMTPVLRQHVYPNGSSDAITAIGIDPSSFATAAWTRPGLSSPPLASAVSQMSESPGYVELQRPVSELMVYVRGLGQPGALEVDLRDSSGQRCACSLGNLDFTDWRELRVTPTFQSPARYPLRLYSFEFTTNQPIRPGDFAVSFLQARYTDSPSPVVVESFQDANGWWVRDPQGLAFAPGPGPPLRVGTPALDVPVNGVGNVAVKAPFTGSDPPVLMAAPTMARLGLRPGMTLPITVGGRDVVTKVVGVIDYVPTLYPGSDDFIVLPLDRMLSSFSAVGRAAETPNELWFSLTSAGWSSAEKLTPSTTIDFVVDRRHAEQVALNDPVLIQLRANLAIGFACAVALAVLGFTVHFLIAGRRRLAEHSVLQANGLDPEDIRRGIALEQAVVFVFALLVGLVLALIEIELLLPSLQLGSAPEDVIPATVLRFDWTLLSVGVVLIGGIVALLAWLTRRVGSAVNIVEELRRLG